MTRPMSYQHPEPGDINEAISKEGVVPGIWKGNFQFFQERGQPLQRIERPFTV